jgi:3-hydroxybutyrate dehydrogenase
LPSQSWSSFWSDTETSSYKSIDINLTALIRGTRLAIRDQITRSPGRPCPTTIGVILNITSLAAQFALFNQPLYCSTKAAVSSFTRALGNLYPEYGIKVVAVAPGMVKTPLWTANPENMKMVGEQDVMLSPRELAEAMLELTESAEYPGGSVLEVLKGKTRLVGISSEPPSGEGSTMSNMGLIYEDSMAILERERTGKRK